MRRNTSAKSVAELKQYQTQDEANQDLAAGRIDALQADQVAEQDFLDSPTGKACCVSVGVVADGFRSSWAKGAGVGIRKGDTALKDKINAAIAEIRKDGEYDGHLEEILQLRHLRRLTYRPLQSRRGSRCPRPCRIGSCSRSGRRAGAWHAAARSSWHRSRSRSGAMRSGLAIGIARRGRQALRRLHHQGSAGRLHDDRQGSPRTRPDRASLLRRNRRHQSARSAVLGFCGRRHQRPRSRDPGDRRRPGRLYDRSPAWRHPGDSGGADRGRPLLGHVDP